jgi:hypothetical protein
VGTTLSTESSFNSDYGLSVKVSGPLDLGSVEVSGDYSSTETTSNSETISQTQQNDIKATGNQDGINHDQDTFILLLNPSVSVYSGESFHPAGTAACAPSIEWRAGVKGVASEPYKLTVQELKHFAALPTNVAQVMQAHGITQDDFNTILSLDPFANGPAPIDDARYVRTTHTFPYEPPDISQECNNSGVCSCMVMSSANIQNDLTTKAVTSKTSYSVGLTEAGTFGNKALLSAKVTATQKFTWTTTSSTTNTTSSSKSATVTIPCPSVNWKSADDYTQIDIYWDTWYGSFMFSPTVAVESAAGANTFVAGHVTGPAGQALRHEAVDVSAEGHTYHTVTDSYGNYAVYGIKVVGDQQTQKPQKAIVHIRANTFAVSLADSKPITLSVK